MSRSTKCSFTCPCGRVFDSTIYEYVNIATDPQLQYTVLAGLLNASICPSCGRRVTHTRPFIYSDPVHHLLAYVHPCSNTPEDTRLRILEKLHGIYERIKIGHEKFNTHDSTRGDPSTAISSVSPQNMPPLQVVFGYGQLHGLINASLRQDERLGKLALSTLSRNEAERGQMLDIARKLSSEMQCQIAVKNMPGEYVVWLYGSRRQIGALMRELAPRG